MSQTIKYEVGYPPAIHCLRIMAHRSPTRNNTKGSFELYEAQNALGSLGEKRVNDINGSAPGSPRSVQDLKQMVLDLQRELEESKRKRTELQQIIVNLSNSQTNTSASTTDVFLEGSLSNNTIEENVRDAQMKHLQRKVTFLQAKLHNHEGWTKQVASTMKERDEALDKATRLSNEMKQLQVDNHQLHQTVESLRSSLGEVQQKFQRTTEELQTQVNNGLLVVQLRQEVERQRSEITNLKESVMRLDMENRNLKDPNVDISSQSMGNVACSQELEHLHKVVDTLKNTVLEQRHYLLNLRRPNTSSNASCTSKSLPTSSTSINSNGFLGQNSSPRRTSTSPSQMSNDIALEPFSQQAGFKLLNQVPGLRSGSPKEGLTEVRHPVLVASNSTPACVQEATTGQGRKLGSGDIVGQLYEVDILSSPSPLQIHASGEECTAYTIASTSSSSPDQLKQQVQGDMNVKNGGVLQAVGSAPIRLQIRRTSQSEVLGQRNDLGKMQIDHWGSKSEILDCPARPQNMAFNHSGLSSSQVQSFQTARPVQHEAQVIYNDFLTPAGLHRSFVANGVNMPTISESNRAAENLSKPQHQQIYLPPPNCQDSSGLTIGLDLQATVPTLPTQHLKPTQSSGVGHEVLYVNTPSGRVLNPIHTSSSVDPDPLRTKVNSDRVCPVCSGNYSHMSMEDFQTHVFECFDDDSAPETMKPVSPAERQCPMCNARFGPGVIQSEFEKHVHSHFGEEGPIDNFEILQP